MFDALMIASGLLWTLTYALVIRRGFMDRTYGIPAAALAANVAWEFWFTLVAPQSGLQQAVNGLWLGLDAVIVYQFFRYSGREFPDTRPWQRSAAFAAALGVSGGLIVLLGRELDDAAGVYAAFGQNLAMSVLFLQMLYTRSRLPAAGEATPNPLRGQSPLIALTKLLGTAAASAAFMWVAATEGTLAGSRLLPFLYATCLTADGIYLFASCTSGTARVPLPTEAVIRHMPRSRV